MASAMATGLIDGFFIDITPQVLPNVSDPTDPVDAPVPYAKNVDSLCEYCSAERRAALLDGLGLALAELAAACPKAIIICNPTDYGACNTQFFVRFPCPAPPSLPGLRVQKPIVSLRSTLARRRTTAARCLATSTSFRTSIRRPIT